MFVKKAGLAQSRNVTGSASWLRSVAARKISRRTFRRQSSKVQPLTCWDAALNLLAVSQGSSAVEQGTHKPLVGSSILPPGSFCMAWVYILRGSNGRHYIGSAVDLDGIAA